MDPKVQIRSLWYLQSLTIFIFGFVFFLISAYYSPSMKRWESIIYCLIFLILIVSIIAIKKGFNLIFTKDALEIQELLRKTSIPYAEIKKISIRQSPWDKFLHMEGLIISFHSPKDEDSVTVKAFGVSFIDSIGILFPNRYGRYVNIPGLSPQNADALKNTLLKYCGDNPPEITNITIAQPPYTTLSKISYIVNIFLIWILLLVILLSIAFYTYLKTVAR